VSLIGLAVVLSAVLQGGADPLPRAEPASASGARGEAAPLAFRDFFEATPRELRPSGKLLALEGRRVRLVGFMAQMEQPPRGGFYLTPRPVFCDEAGGGTADLPPESVRVVVRSSPNQPIAFAPGALEVTGVLELGNRGDQEGRVSAVRLVLDRPEDLPKRAHVPGRDAKRARRTTPVPNPSQEVAK
jgi:hypothetical protein